jgi:hypothetical protein
MSAAEIHRELCPEVYVQNVMSEGTVRQWCRMFKDGRTNVHDEERSGQPAICSEWWWSCSKCWPKIWERQIFTIQKFRVSFTNFTHGSLRDYQS